MILKKNYVDINDTLRHVKIQIIDSIPFADKVVPDLKDPEALFKWLKARVKYENDPRGVELLQTMQTLFKRGGKGDCDCFVITTIASMISLGWHDIKIVLAGRSKKYPVHIYTSITWKGKRRVFDLTNSKYDYERPGYKYKQELPVKWENWR